MNLSINPEIVLEKIGNIKAQMDLVAQSVSNLESNISSGWSSENVGVYFTPTIKKVKDSIEEINSSVNNIKSNVEMYVKNVKTADVKGEFTDGSSSARTIGADNNGITNNISTMQ